ncbi:MAG: hypothetical protein VBE63_25530 [Lamprobacter sp.]|uniref:hypothetical protein n=1 Tax=Lamprobacter sp. TaxID=3100796 RepID=UPI002B258F2F|nr:hypothetical protein [Lamprobacter sp.]MEA3643270.1 hypothetical protein [Lamprobacter sp.]
MTNRAGYPRRERLRPVSDGIDFLGYIVRRDYQLARRRVVTHLHQRLRGFEAELVSTGRYLRRYRFEPLLLDALHANLASYLGHLRQADTFHLREVLWARYDFLRQYFSFDPASARLTRRDQPHKGLTSVCAQYAWFRRAYPDGVLNRRRARYGFPLARARAYARRLLKAGRCVLVVAQTDQVWTGVRER